MLFWTCRSKRYLALGRRLSTFDIGRPLLTKELISFGALDELALVLKTSDVADTGEPVEI